MFFYEIKSRVIINHHMSILFDIIHRWKYYDADESFITAWNLKSGLIWCGIFFFFGNQMYTHSAKKFVVYFAKYTLVCRLKKVFMRDTFS